MRTRDGQRPFEGASNKSLKPTPPAFGLRGGLAQPLGAVHNHSLLSTDSTLAGPLQRRALVRSVSSGILEHWGMSGLQMIQASQLPCWDEWADLTGVAGRSSVAT